MKIAKAWGLMGYKPKQDHTTGEWIEDVGCKLNFPKGTKVNDIDFNNQDVVVMSMAEYETLMSSAPSVDRPFTEIFNKLDSLSSGFLSLAELVRERAEKGE